VHSDPITLRKYPRYLKYISWNCWRQKNRLQNQKFGNYNLFFLADSTKEKKVNHRGRRAAGRRRKSVAGELNARGHATSDASWSTEGRLPWPPSPLDLSRPATGHAGVSTVKALRSTLFASPPNGFCSRNMLIKRTEQRRPLNTQSSSLQDIIQA